MRRLSATNDSQRALAFLRLFLGMLQIAGVGFSLALLLYTGVTTYSLVAVVVTCLVTSVSVLLFGSWLKRNSRH